MGRRMAGPGGLALLGCVDGAAVSIIMSPVRYISGVRCRSDCRSSLPFSESAEDRGLLS